MKIFFTGGTGFFGKAVLRRILATRWDKFAADIEVTVMSRSPARFLLQYPEFSAQSWLRVVEGDIGRPETFPHGETFTHILHAAADSTDVAGQTPLGRFDQIVGGTRNMLEFALTCGASRFLLTSSGGAYGPQPPEMTGIPESWHALPDPLQPGGSYGVAKRQAEHLCCLYGQQYGLETVVARCFAFVGGDLPRNAHFAIGNFIRDALESDRITVGGDGTPVRSYLHQDELAQWLLVLLERGRGGQAYNVGSDEAVSIAELAQLVRDVLAPGKHVDILGKREAVVGLRNRYVPDIAKIAAELGLKPTISLAEAIRLSVVPAEQG